MHSYSRLQAPLLPTAKLLLPTPTPAPNSAFQQEFEFAIPGKNLKAAHFWGAGCVIEGAEKSKGPGQGESGKGASVCPLQSLWC